MKPARRRPTAMERRQAREAAEHRAMEDHFASAFRFLVTDLGYTEMGRIPVTLPDVEVRRFVNARAKRQLEFSGRPFGYTFEGVLRRFIGSGPAAYDDLENCLALYEIVEVVWPEESERFNHNSLGWKAVVDATAELLRENVDLLTGASWIPRANVTRVEDREFRQKFGMTPRRDIDGFVAQFRKAFAFLPAAGFEITFDSDRLTSHEYMVERLTYAGAEHVVDLERGDIRDGVWTLTVDGQRVGADFHPTADEIESHARQVAKLLRLESSS